jgi:hypothetical protein
MLYLNLIAIAGNASLFDEEKHGLCDAAEFGS